MMTNSDLQQFRKLLPFWVNGSLPEDQQQFMSEFLQQYPRLQAEVDFNHALRQTVKTVDNRYDMDAGLQRLLQAIRNERNYTSISWLKRLKNICQYWGLTPAFAAMALVVIIQNMMLWELYKTDSTVTVLNAYRSMPEVASIADIKISINPDVDFGQLVILLRQSGTHIVNGPSESGELWLALDDRSRLDAVVQKLSNATSIVDVMVIARSGR